MSETLHTAQTWLARIRQLPLDRPVAVMNVCGGHERSLAMLGLRAVLPKSIRIIPGPGCPVCVCPEDDLADAITLATANRVILVAFGDMLRVPINAPKGQIRSLAAAREAGADVRPVASPQEAVAIAHAEPRREVVFFVAGFETTSAPVAAMLAEGVPDNLTVLLAARLTWPAVEMLLRDGHSTLDALIAPGHVATIMGANEWGFIAERYCLPVAVAGFTGESLLAALYSVLRQSIQGEPFLDNCYPELVTASGNIEAQRLLAEVFEIIPAMWRGIGIIPDSGFGLRGPWQRYDARLRHVIRTESRPRAGEMPPGCDCAAVVLGQIAPDHCRLYGKACIPSHPIGPCMVSDEGACHIWWQAGVRPG
ncbi:MAG: hydrogenase formation protein HypD [Acidiphilium sp.]|nr:hydrogenase formation protein HypD [Acidiphilium sp.]MDD4935105.1 hydrogenase formation protein HypD [Acidiphilium sp.]